MPQFPINAEQNYTNWKALFNNLKQEGKINEDTIIIAHSIAPIFVVKWVAETNTKINKLISVSGFNNHKLIKEFDDVNFSFFIDQNLEFENFITLCENRICFVSDNDPYIPLNKLNEFVNLVNGQKVFVKDAGHFNKSAGYLEFPQILEFI
ncbi:MAG: alpha/beta hydrolase [Clostridia bacterium]|nr:alpha/beta hydrolase [Clostridia bacterium]